MNRSPPHQSKAQDFRLFPIQVGFRIKPVTLKAQAAWKTGRSLPHSTGEVFFSMEDMAGRRDLASILLVSRIGSWQKTEAGIHPCPSAVSHPPQHSPPERRTRARTRLRRAARCDGRRGARAVAPRFLPAQQWARAAWGSDWLAGRARAEPDPETPPRRTYKSRRTRAPNFSPTPRRSRGGRLSPPPLLDAASPLSPSAGSRGRCAALRCAAVATRDGASEVRTWGGFGVPLAAAAAACSGHARGSLGELGVGGAFGGGRSGSHEAGECGARGRPAFSSGPGKARGLRPRTGGGGSDQAAVAFLSFSQLQSFASPPPHASLSA